MDARTDVRRSCALEPSRPLGKGRASVNHGEREAPCLYWGPRLLAGPCVFTCGGLPPASSMV